jgi:hypothetical protein
VLDKPLCNESSRDSGLQIFANDRFAFFSIMFNLIIVKTIAASADREHDVENSSVSRTSTIDLYY